MEATTQAEQAEQELRAILDAIGEEEGTRVAREAARTLLVAVEEGRIKGDEYGDRCDYYSGDGDRKVPLEQFKGCIMGHLAQLRDSWSCGTPDVPVWNDQHGEYTSWMSPLERHIYQVELGDKPATSPALADVHTWLTTILAV